MGGLYIGTSGYTYAAWRGVFYPKGVAQRTWLSFYAQHFNAVEINATFYRPFPQSVFARWQEMTPPDFHFVLKAPRIITHEKKLHDIENELNSFLSSIEGLGEKLALILWQFPAGQRADDLKERFSEFVSTLPRSPRHVFEFRHASWFTEDLYAHLEQQNAGFVINDSPHMKSQEVNTAGLMYIRFHGPGKLYDSSYSLEQLESWAERIRPRLADHEVYLFFNNTFAGQALENARQLRDLLAE